MHREFILMRTFTLVPCANAVVLKLVCITARFFWVAKGYERRLGNKPAQLYVYGALVGWIGRWCRAGLLSFCFQDRLFIIPSLHGSASAS